MHTQNLNLYMYKHVYVYIFRHISSTSATDKTEYLPEL